MHTDDIAPSRSANSFGPAAPVFPVQSLETSIAYYVKALGFKVNWRVNGFASVSRDRCCLFLCEKDQGHPGTWAWIGVNDAAALEFEYRLAGGRIRHPATNYPWAFEVQVEDLDRNVLRFGSDPKEDEPFGSFMDMNGRLWRV